ncbi:hypothetical protein IPJ91_01155 [bacterium]|nr:MAG: hypothetical protein IPJ91_01155 [bacterium]
MNYILFISIGLMFFGKNAAIAISMSVVFVIAEYSFSYIYHLFQKHRLYSYADNSFDLIKYASLVNIGYYAGGVLLIIATTNNFIPSAIKLNINPNQLIILKLLLLLFSIMIATIFLLSKFYNLDNEKLNLQFRFSRYFLSIILPIIFLGVFLTNISTNFLFIFLIGSVTGSIGEGALGNTINLIVSKRYKHWEYFDYPIMRRYTSILMLPVWGIAAVIIFMFINIL